MKVLGALVVLMFIAAGDLRPLEKKDLEVTEGALEIGSGGRLEVNVPKMRAVSRAKGGSIAELRFEDLGRTDRVALLASGENRRQIGIKLKAQDSCNVLYVMWRFEPRSGVVVSLKKNPGKRSHAECGATGYKNLNAEVSRRAPEVRPHEQHVLRAELDGDALVVLADREIVWRGAIGPEASALEGPIGIRSDNGRFAIELYAK